jgi:uncharacterized protein YndB with AHSA1/START domain
MKANAYHFITEWRVEAQIQDVYRLISRPADFPRWWPMARGEESLKRELARKR